MPESLITSFKMDWMEAIMLGIIQGLTEFLPVSSSGHLEITKATLGVDPESGFYFAVANAYVKWYDVPDNEVIEILEHYR